MDHRNEQNKTWPKVITRLLLIVVVLFIFNFNYDFFNVGADIGPVACEAGQCNPGFIAKWVPSTGSLAPPIDMDLKVNGANHDTQGTKFLVQPGDDLFFTWNTTNTNASAACSSSGGSGTWAQASIATARGNATGSDWATNGLRLTAPSTAGDYTYSATCTKDDALGQNKLDVFLSLIDVNEAAASDDTDSVIVNVGGGNPGLVTFSANPPSITTGGTTTLTWNAPGATSCTAMTPNFNTGGLPSGSTPVTPTGTAVFTISCDNGGFETITVILRKKPTFIEN